MVKPIKCTGELKAKRILMISRNTPTESSEYKKTPNAKTSLKAVSI